MNIKGTCSYLTILSLLLVNSVAIAKQFNIKGDNQQIFEGILGDKDEFSFQLKKHESISISITQPNADVKVVLTKVANQHIKQVYELSTAADTWLNELLYITSEDCISCIVTVLPQEQMDQSGSYQLTFQRKASIDPSEKNIMKFASKAAIAWQKANTDYTKFNDYLEEALSFYERAIELSKSGNRQLLLARNLYHASQVEHLLSNYDQQRKRLSQVLTFLDNKKSPILLSALYDFAITTTIQRQLEQASTEYIQVQHLAKDQHNELMEALAISGLARIHYEQRQYQQALILNNKALEIYIALGSWQNIIRTRLSIGIIYEGQGDLEKAIGEYHQALSFSNSTLSTKHIVDANIKLAIVQRKLGNFEDANHYIDLALINSHKLPHRVLDGRAKQQKAQILMALGQLDYAADIFEEAYDAYSVINAQTDMVNIEYFLSIVHSQLENFLLAKKYAISVLENDKKTAVKYDIGTAYFRLAAISLGLQEYAEAEYLNESALENLVNTENLTLKGNLFAQTAEIYFHNGQVEKGLSYFEKSRQAHAQGQSLFGALDTEYRYANMQSLYGEPLLALTTLKAIEAKVDEIQNSINRGDLRRSYLDKQQNIAGLTVHILNQLERSSEEMLAVSEQFRTITLQEKMRALVEVKPVDPSYLKQRKALENQLQTQVINYQQLAMPAERKLIVKQTRHLSSQLQQLESQFKKQKKHEHEHEQIIATEKLNIEQIQSTLAQDALILYFDTGKLQSHLWAISQSSLSHFLLPSESEIAQNVNELLLQVTQQPKSKRANRHHTQQPAIEKLSQSLFSNTDIQWHNYKQILVIPDGSLHSVPFSVLTVGDNRTSLLETQSISYLPSLSTYQYLSTMDSNIISSDKILLVANPSMKDQDTTIAPKYSLSRGGFESSALPYTEYEARAIENIFADNATSLLESQASKNQFLSHSLERYQIVHFATHGVSHSFSPSMAGLVLSNINTDNNLLLAPEISQLNIPAKMVVLSGCETAKGQLMNGEGLMGLSRAFFEAGAKSVVASLWSVQDKATAELMKQFYRYLFEQNLPANEALKLAKLSVKNFRKKNGHMPWREPYFWAGFVLQSPL